MTILAHYQKHEVEILDVYEMAGEKLAVVKATTGKPFMGGDKWPVKTEFATVKAADLDKSPEANQSNNLLSMALSYADKTQWSSGETVWLWRNGKAGAYLSAGSGEVVNLHLTGYAPYVRVFWLNHKSWSWEVSRNVHESYHRWAASYQKEVAK